MGRKQLIVGVRQGPTFAYTMATVEDAFSRPANQVSAEWEPRLGLRLDGGVFTPQRINRLLPVRSPPAALPK